MSEAWQIFPGSMMLNFSPVLKCFFYRTLRYSKSAVILHLCTVHFASPAIITVIDWEIDETVGVRKWRTWKLRKVHVILDGKPQWRWPFRRQRRTWEDNIKPYFKTLINTIFSTSLYCYTMGIILDSAIEINFLT